MERGSVPLHSLSPLVQYTGEKECACTTTVFVSIGPVHWGEGVCMYHYTLCLHWSSTLGRRSVHVPLHSLSPLVQYTEEKECACTTTLFVPIGPVHWGEGVCMYHYSLCPHWSSTLGRRSVHVPLHSLSPLVQYTGEKECACTTTLFVPIGTVHWGKRVCMYHYTLCPRCSGDEYSMYRQGAPL